MSKNIVSEFAYEQTLRLAGGADTYSVHTLSAIYAECYNNEEISRLSGYYLFGSSEYAKRNLAKLDEHLAFVFGLEPMA
jgi:hypothetical protein